MLHTEEAFSPNFSGKNVRIASVNRPISRWPKNPSRPISPVPSSVHVIAFNVRVPFDGCSLAIPPPNVLSWREWIIIRSSEDHCEINRARNRGYRVAVSSERKRETNIKVGKDRDGDYLKLRRPDDVAILSFLP